MANKQDYIFLSEEEDKKLSSLIKKMLEMGMGAVYGIEDAGIPDAEVQCEERMKECRAKCCTFQFALTKEEVKQGRIQYNTKRPYFIARDMDGYCPHLDRETLICTVYEERPLRCRRYDCRDDPDVRSAKS